MPCCTVLRQVTVIPVVAKADTMTDEELATFRQEVGRMSDMHCCLASMHSRTAILRTSCLKK
jgi:hypothetical protein